MNYYFFLVFFSYIEFLSLISPLSIPSTHPNPVFGLDKSEHKESESHGVRDGDLSEEPNERSGDGLTDSLWPARGPFDKGVQLILSLNTSQLASEQQEISEMVAVPDGKVGERDHVGSQFVVEPTETTVDVTAR